MKKLFVFMAIAFAISSCSRDEEQIEHSSTAFEDFAKSGNSTKDLYFQLISKHFSNPDEFDKLPLETKVDLYEYKYDRFLAENTLSDAQKEAVLALKFYVQDQENEDYDLSNDQVIAVYSNFDNEQGTFLLGHLGNSPIDYEPPTETTGCWWCWRVGEVTNPCHMEFRGGQPIGFYQTVTMERHGAFGIRNPNRDIENVLIPCD